MTYTIRGSKYAAAARAHLRLRMNTWSWLCQARVTSLCCHKVPGTMHCCSWSAEASCPNPYKCWLT